MSKLNAFYAEARAFARVAAKADHVANETLKPAIARLLAAWEDVPVRQRPEQSEVRGQLRAMFAPAYGLGVATNSKGELEFCRPTADGYDKAADGEYLTRKNAARQRIQFVVGKMGFETASADSIEVDAAMLRAAKALIKACGGDKKAIAAALAQAAK